MEVIKDAQADVSNYWGYPKPLSREDRIEMHDVKNPKSSLNMTTLIFVHLHNNIVKFFLEQDMIYWKKVNNCYQMDFNH